MAHDLDQSEFGTEGVRRIVRAQAAAAQKKAIGLIGQGHPT